jgi:hypothetical protein
MSDPESFLARWSRRKHAEIEATKPAATPPATTENVDVDDARQPSVAPQPPELRFDPTKLPPIESITAESDIGAFLAPGVPPELTRAALRRAWATDPKIRDFIGLSENAWDFNAQGAMGGFGALEITDDLRRQIAQLFTRSGAVETASSPDPPSVEAEAARAEQAAVETSVESVPAIADASLRVAKANPAKYQDAVSQDAPAKVDGAPHTSNAFSQCDMESLAMQNDREQPDNAKLIVKRGHGRALPK